jgi:hypothetical protein
VLLHVGQAGGRIAALQAKSNKRHSWHACHAYPMLAAAEVHAHTHIQRDRFKPTTQTEAAECTRQSSAAS